MAKDAASEASDGWPEPLHGSLDTAQSLPEVASDRVLSIPSGRPLRLGLISDTHLTERGLPIPVAAIRLLEGSDYILHAGDIACEPVLEELRGVAPVLAVSGNVDAVPWSMGLAAFVTLRAGPWRLALVHDAGDREGRATRARSRFGPLHALVFGHSHQPGVWHAAGMLLINPGSAVHPRRAPRRTVGRLEIGDRLEATVLPFDP